MRQPVHPSAAGPAVAASPLRQNVPVLREQGRDTRARQIVCATTSRKRRRAGHVSDVLLRSRCCIEVACGISHLSIGTPLGCVNYTGDIIDGVPRAGISVLLCVVHNLYYAYVVTLIYLVER